MSDLQLSLLIIGVLVVGGVTAFNWFQQWRLRRKLEQSFGQQREDVLLREQPARPAASRIEPQIGGAPDLPPEDFDEPAAAAAAAVAEAGEPLVPTLPAVAEFDPAIDYVVAIDAQEAVSAAALADLHDRVAACGRPYRIVGYNAATGEWEEASRLGGTRYAHLRLALQLVNRNGAVDAATLGAFCTAARECAQQAGATVSCPDIETAVAHARELDAFCSEVDVAIGVNIVASTSKFGGTRIRALAEAAGLRLQPQGVFHYCDAERNLLFTLDNHEPAPLLPEQIKNISTSGVTLLLDVPRVAQGQAALDLMLTVGDSLARELSGTLVDDNRVPLQGAALEAIRRQLKSIQDVMEARGISPGSERALRLFS